MDYYLPNYEECLEIVKNNEAFYKSKKELDGVTVEIFNYRLAMSKDFVEPIPGSKIQAHEMRGITFVHDNGKIHRFLMLHKFFNLNQVSGNQYGDLSPMKIIRIQDKLDGSMVRFIRLPNGRILAKTKMGLDNPEALLAQGVYDKNEELQKFVKATLDSNLAAIFEIVSPMNRIVCYYPKTDLVLLQLREEATGQYRNIYSDSIVNSHRVSVVCQKPILSLDEYIAKTKTDLGVEGWVLTFENGQMVKLKTEEYFSLHGLLTESLARENLILGMVLSDTIDDAISLLDSNDIRKNYAEAIQKAVVHYLKETTVEVLELTNLYSGNKKAWAAANKRHPLFGIAARVVGRDNIEEDIVDQLKNRLKKDVFRLHNAQDWLKYRGVNLQDMSSFFQNEET
jgi:T4 RnlA family RNA ligase